ncbi:Uncharacterised protein [Vibrio cholerae]|nr:Uncharacterised protein [Vibrio cholerae]
MVVITCDKHEKIIFLKGLAEKIGDQRSDHSAFF